MIRQPGRTRSSDTRHRLSDDPTEHLGTLADLVWIAGQERVDRDRVGHRATGGPGVQVTTPTSLWPRPLIVQPSPSWTVSSSSAARNRASFGPAGSIQSWRRMNASRTSRDSNRRCVDRDHRDPGPPTARLEQLEEVGQGRQPDPCLAVDRRPERIGRRRGHALHQDRDTDPAGRRLERVDERPDRLDVVADVRDEGDVGLVDAALARVGRRPARLDGPDVLDRVVLGDLEQTLEHRRRRVEGDDRTARRVERAGDRQREATGARADVEPRVARPDELEQRRQDGIVGRGSGRPGTAS